MSIVNLSHNRILAQTVVVADSPSARMKGLLGRDELPQGEALIITHCQSIHMFFMKFSIDVVFVDKNNKIVGLCPNIQPFQLSPIFFNAFQAIELPSGTITATQTQHGDLLQIS